MKMVSRLFLILALVSVAAYAADRQTEVDRVERAKDVMNHALNEPQGIPQHLLATAKCVVIMPSVVKAGFIVGGSYGKGVMVCRTGNDYTGPWGRPAMYQLEGGSFGFQAGGSSTEFVMLVMNDRGVNALLNSKVKLGADVSVAAGPVGRTAEAATDASLRAEILTYSRSKGLFAGVSLDGASLRPDKAADQAFYGRRIAARDIVTNPAPTKSAAAQQLDSLLDQAAPQA